MQLMRAHTLFAGCHEPIRQRPFSQRNVAAFHDAASADGELAVAVLAFAKARADFLRRVGSD